MTKILLKEAIPALLCELESAGLRPATIHHYLCHGNCPVQPDKPAGIEPGDLRPGINSGDDLLSWWIFLFL